MTAEVLAWAVLFFALCGASITGITVAAKWIMGRARAHEAERTAAATFDRDFIPTAAEVARRQADDAYAAELDLVIEDLAEIGIAVRTRPDPNTPERQRLRKSAYIRRAAAWSRGYFFLPCPLCGTEFAGYEWEEGASIPDPEYPVGSGRGVAICPACAHEGRAEDIGYIGALA